jgi:hypothetical protein
LPARFCHAEDDQKPLALLPDLKRESRISRDPEISADDHGSAAAVAVAVPQLDAFISPAVDFARPLNLAEGAKLATIPAAAVRADRD